MRRLLRIHSASCVTHFAAMRTQNWSLRSVQPESAHKNSLIKMVLRLQLNYWQALEGSCHLISMTGCNAAHARPFAHSAAAARSLRAQSRLPCWVAAPGCLACLPKVPPQSTHKTPFRLHPRRLFLSAFLPSSAQLELVPAGSAVFRILLNVHRLALVASSSAFLSHEVNNLKQSHCVSLFTAALPISSSLLSGLPCR